MGPKEILARVRLVTERLARSFAGHPSASGSPVDPVQMLDESIAEMEAERIEATRILHRTPPSAAREELLGALALLDAKSEEARRVRTRLLEKRAATSRLVALKRRGDALRAETARLRDEATRMGRAEAGSARAQAIRQRAAAIDLEWASILEEAETLRAPK